MDHTPNYNIYLGVHKNRRYYDQNSKSSPEQDDITLWVDMVKVDILK